MRGRPRIDDHQQLFGGEHVAGMAPVIRAVGQPAPADPAPGHSPPPVRSPPLPSYALAGTTCTNWKNIEEDVPVSSKQVEDFAARRAQAHRHACRTKAVARRGGMGILALVIPLVLWNGAPYVEEGGARYLVDTGASVSAARTVRGPLSEVAGGVLGGTVRAARMSMPPGVDGMCVFNSVSPKF